MRTAILPLILAVAVAPLTARQAAAIQQNPKAEKSAADSSAKVAAPAVAVEATDSGKVQLSKATVDSLTQLVSSFRRDPEAVALPPTAQIAMGGRTIPAGTAVAFGVATLCAAVAQALMLIVPSEARFLPAPRLPGG